MLSKDAAIIGDHDFITGFKALGWSLYPVDEKEDLEAVFKKAVEEGFLCIYILEDLARKISGLLEEYKEKTKPLIFILPDFRKDLGLTDKTLSELTKKAIGQELL